MKATKHLAIGILVLLLLVALAGCKQGKPTVTVVSTTSSTISENQDVTLQATAADSKGIVRVELSVDDKPAAVANVAPAQKAVTVPLTWKAVAGRHVLTVRAINQDEVASEPETVNLDVAAAAKPTVAPTQAAATVVPTVSAGTPAATRAATTAATAIPPTTAATQAPPTAIPPTATPTAVPPTATPQPTVCGIQMAFVGDVTVPDGSTMQPNQTFSKVWRLRNTGTCPWNAQYTFVYVGGTLMSADRAVAVPDAATGQEVNVAVAMTAPANPGTYTVEWQLRAPNGTLFGNKVTARIVVPTPDPCPNPPVIASFSADRTTINRGEATVLRWGNVSGAQRVEIDNGIGGVGAPGDRVVAPAQTTTFTLVATCGSKQTRAVVTIVVNQPAPTAVPRISLSGNWNAANFTMELQEALGCGQYPCSYTGRLIRITQGTPEIYTISSGSFNGSTLTLTMPGLMPGAPALTFTGSANSSSISGHLSDGTQIQFNR